MRSFLHLLTLVAVLFAPLAAPAAAMAPAQQAAECQDMGMGSANHEMPAGKHSGSATCCLAVCSVIAMPPGAIDRSEPVGHLAYQPLYESFRLGAGPSTDDPPPRRA
ncbi:MAG: hypothetical protein ABIR25_01085 [Sphingomicrobium sp.]